MTAPSMTEAQRQRVFRWAKPICFEMIRNFGGSWSNPRDQMAAVQTVHMIWRDNLSDAQRAEIAGPAE